MNLNDTTFADTNPSPAAQAWSAIRSHKLTAAKELLNESNPTPASMERANIQMMQGIIACLEADFCQAEAQFGAVLDYYLSLIHI